MDIHILESYLTVAREGSITAAAELLHISQPALSRQMKELEKELGVTLFIRGNRRIRLTEEGMILRRRAEEMTRLYQQTEKELSVTGKTLSGDIYIGAGESPAFHTLSRTAAALIRRYPDIRVHITSGDTDDLMDRLEHGLIDLALIFSDFDRQIYQYLDLPEKDSFGVILRKDSPLAGKDVIHFRDLQDVPVIMPRGSMSRFTDNEMFAGIRTSATYNLIYNASLMAEDGLGPAIVFDKLINFSAHPVLCFRPLSPEVSVSGTVIWKKYRMFTPAVQLYLDMLRESLTGDQPI